MNEKGTTGITLYLAQYTIILIWLHYQLFTRHMVATDVLKQSV